MLQEINSEEICPYCNEELHITGIFISQKFIHTCFKCKTSFIHGNKQEEIDENLRIGSTEFLDKSKKYD